MIKELGDLALTENTARAAVDRGDYQVCVIIPAGAFDRAHTRAALLVDAMGNQAGDDLNPLADEGIPEDATDSLDAQISVRFDPTARDIYRQFVLVQLQRLSQSLEIHMITEAMQVLSGENSGIPDDAASGFDWDKQELISLGFDDTALPGEASPNSVQQNIPAWTLFAMFLIAIPLAGSIIKERDYGTLRRLRAMPISAATMLSAKIVVHVLVCLVQFGMMLLLGRFVLPLVGTPTLGLGSHSFALLAVAMASALAATGFGILVGSVAKTNEQASVFTATAVVIGAGLGGLMVPSFLMPPAMVRIGRFLPLNWGLDAFLELFVRDGNLLVVLPQILQLLAFFAVATTLAVLFSARRT